MTLHLQRNGQTASRMNNDIKLIAEAYDQQMNDMKAALNAPRESRDSGSVLLDDEGHYFEWWKDAHGPLFLRGTIYDKNDDIVTDERSGNDEIHISMKEVGKYSLAALVRAAVEWSTWFNSDHHVTTIDELKVLPQKTIVLYPEHGSSFGSYLTRDALLIFLEESSGFEGPRTRKAILKAAKETGGEPQQSAFLLSDIPLPAKEEEEIALPILVHPTIQSEDDYPALIDFITHMQQNGWNIVSAPQNNDEFAVATNVIGEVNSTFPLSIFATIEAK